MKIFFIQFQIYYAKKEVKRIIKDVELQNNLKTYADALAHIENFNIGNYNVFDYLSTIYKLLYKSLKKERLSYLEYDETIDFIKITSNELVKKCKTIIENINVLAEKTNDKSKITIKLINQNFKIIKNLKNSLLEISIYLFFQYHIKLENAKENFYQIHLLLIKNQGIIGQLLFEANEKDFIQEIKTLFDKCFLVHQHIINLFFEFTSKSLFIINEV